MAEMCEGAGTEDADLIKAQAKAIELVSNVDIKILKI